MPRADSPPAGTVQHLAALPRERQALTQIGAGHVGVEPPGCADQAYGRSGRGPRPASRHDLGRLARSRLEEHRLGHVPQTRPGGRPGPAAAPTAARGSVGPGSGVHRQPSPVPWRGRTGTGWPPAPAGSGPGSGAGPATATGRPTRDSSGCAQRVERPARELGRLVEEQHAAVGERRPRPGGRPRSAADQRRGRRGVVRAPGTAAGHQRRDPRQQPGDRVHRGDLERLVGSQRRQHRRAAAAASIVLPAPGGPCSRR